MVAEAVRRELEAKEHVALDNYDSEDNLPAWAVADED